MKLFLFRERSFENIARRKDYKARCLEQNWEELDKAMGIIERYRQIAEVNQILYTGSSPPVLEHCMHQSSP